jgi:hypothetical protein
MSTLISYVVGPELIWFVAWMIIYQIGKQNAVPPHRFNRLLGNLHWWIAPILILTFILLRVPFVEQTGLIIRIWIAGLLGAHILLKTGLSAHSEQGPGIGAVYVNGTTKAVLFLILFTIIVYLRF